VLSGGPRTERIYHYQMRTSVIRTSWTTEDLPRAGAAVRGFPSVFGDLQRPGRVVGLLCCWFIMSTSCRRAGELRPSDAPGGEAKSECTMHSFAVRPGLCRVQIEEGTTDALRRYTFLTLKCGEGASPCGRPFQCDCSRAVDPFPCEPALPEKWPWHDGVYSRGEFEEQLARLRAGSETLLKTDRREVAIDPSTPLPGALAKYGVVNEGSYDKCEVFLSEPLYGTCSVTGAVSGVGGLRHFGDRIEFGGAKSICGIEFRCACPTSKGR
jgi:hypothetical protein